jgi:hypothetical protein
MANVIKMLLSLRVLNIFSKTPFFHYLQNLQKPTAMFDVLKKKKTNIHFNFAHVLWVAFSVPSGSLLSLMKYPTSGSRSISKYVCETHLFYHIRVRAESNTTAA